MSTVMPYAFNLGTFKSNILESQQDFRQNPIRNSLLKLYEVLSTLRTERDDLQEGILKWNSRINDDLPPYFQEALGEYNSLILHLEKIIENCICKNPE